MEDTPSARHRAAQPHASRRGARDQAWFVHRPDRVALWAFLMAVFAAVVALASSAEAGSGGMDAGSASASETTGTSLDACQPANFGQRNLALGDCGADVKTLNWILRSNPVTRRVRLGKRFQSNTHRAVRRMQQRRGLRVSGVVNRRTRREIRRTMSREVATWYGPGFWGNRTACGTTLRRRTVGVAHRTLPCGTKVTIAYGGEFVRTKVIDRGPYANGANWDLTGRAAKKIGLETTDTVRVAPIRR